MNFLPFLCNNSRAIIVLLVMKRIVFYLLPFVLMTVACTDDDSFSTSRGDLLTFSQDTICMDTVFSTVPTSTYSFWAYNNNSDGLRLSQVRLLRGRQSGFRVNVDGSYLDNATGGQVTGLEVRKRDSIRVFVELTSHQNYADIPTLVEDQLVFTLESGVEQKVNLRAWSWDALLCHDVVVSRDSVIATNKPIVIYGGLKVDSGVTLTIKAPSKLYFHSGAALEVFGRLAVKGSEGGDGNVVFRGDRTDKMFDYLPYDRVSGQWRGIRFHSSSTGNSICGADIHSADDGIVCDSAAFDSATVRLRLENVTIHNCKGTGLKAYNANIWMANCQLTNTLGDCLAIYGGRAVVAGCTLAQFYPFDADRGVALRFTNFVGDSDYPLYMVECYNTLVTGYGDDEVMGETKDSTGVFNYYFSHCLLRTPAETDSAKMAPFDHVIWETSEDTIQGMAHFVKVDADRQEYDFHLDSLSTARGKAVYLPLYPFDRDGVARKKSNPDIGCYEFRDSR